MSKPEQAIYDKKKCGTCDSTFSPFEYPKHLFRVHRDRYRQLKKMGLI